MPVFLRDLRAAEIDRDLVDAGGDAVARGDRRARRTGGLDWIWPRDGFLAATADGYERQVFVDGRIDGRCLDPDVARVRRGPPGAAAGGEGKDDELYRDPTYQGAAVFPR